MSEQLSVAQVLADLEAQVAFHRDREAFHAQQEEAHREQRALHAAELERMAQHLEAFQAVASRVLPVVRPPAPPPAPAPVSDDLGRRPKLSRAIDHVLAAWPAGEPFGATAVTTEVNRRFGDRLRHPLDVRTASSFLRRRSRDGVLALVREGRPFQEALYRKPG